MKLLITGDIHGRSDLLEEVLNKEQDYDLHLCTGDLGIDIKTLNRHNIVAVKGNNDYYYDLPYERVIDLEGNKILLTHGHLQNVKYGLKELVDFAKSKHVDICIFGHTHQLYIEEIDHILFINPGALSNFRDKSYVIYEEGQVKICYVDANRTTHD
jgi:putative phosphoesterase